jgi:hypothetical protein
MIRACVAMPPAKISASSLLTLMALSAFLGCSNPDSGRASVSGKVTFDGEPVKTGQIAFEPQGQGRFGIAQIVDGAYQMPPQQGPTPGKYTVRITANRPLGKPVQPAPEVSGRPTGESYEQYIPAEYNQRSELTVEIGAEPNAVHNFALTAG